ncbi:RNA 3'-terminal phosphate cyclase domain-containing protein [Radiomyces spectabilis]|uniref:RNA 3'-terminal phosphate cyclase domain-containing protein n=1 Tax=Radiomyces spectabilis TaxID=64574 RepID=UPI00221F126C|nr:RNA 3'-terminal phosphate cyclase domain-containing protein [Radiomyces spectabilis]KAI8388031.1 RNA 3'-terminal phosphate cyclase domain-containing protein [Radiomyces spectabilis]
MSKLVVFEGSNYLRQRLVLATLSGKIVRINKIRSDDENPGIRDYEAKFLQLLEKVTNGSTIEISYTGTSILYKPGSIMGGRVEHECGNERAISYFLEPMIALAPFSKKPFALKLQGITTDHVDVSVDIIRTVLLPQMSRYGIEGNVELKITKRGAPPLGGGEVLFSCNNVRQLKPVQFTDEGRIKRIRGIAYCTRVSPQTANRLVESARSLLNRYIPDVYIYTDVYKGAESGKSPGFALSLVAESTTGALLSAEKAAQPGQTPEDVGVIAAKLLLEEVRKGGCVDSASQWLNLLFMILAPEDVGKIRIGQLTPFTIQYLRDLKAFFGVSFKIQPDEESNTILMTCVGIGYVNHNKKST